MGCSIATVCCEGWFWTPVEKVLRKEQVFLAEKHSCYSYAFLPPQIGRSKLVASLQRSRYCKKLVL